MHACSVERADMLRYSDGQRAVQNRTENFASAKTKNQPRLGRYEHVYRYALRL